FHDVHLVPMCEHTSPVPRRFVRLRYAQPNSLSSAVMGNHRDPVSPLGSWLKDAPHRSADKPPLLGFIARYWRDAGSRNAEGRLRFPSAAFRDVELNAL